MLKIIVKRIISLIPVLIGATFIIFMIMHFAEGDPAREILGVQASQAQVDQLREEMGLNDPVLVQYFNYMVDLLHGDMGVSYRTGEKVSVEIFSRFGNTLLLSLTSIAICLIISLPLGIIAAIKQNTLIDKISMFISMVGISMPVFWLGLLLILYLGLKADLFPVSGFGQWSGLVLPAITLSFRPMAGIARTTRSTMLDVLNEDYVQTARSKGLKEWSVIIVHALKNALIPTITLTGLQLGMMMSNAVVAETVFAWPGIGRLITQSIAARDVPVIVGCVIVFVVVISIINLVVDLLYCAVDPRLRTEVE